MDIRIRLFNVRLFEDAGILRASLKKRTHGRTCILGLVLTLIGAAVGSGSASAEDGGFTLQSPYVFGGHQYKVQLHTHTVNSDGDHTPQWVMQEYAKMGYAAVAITDHHYRVRSSPSLDDPEEHSIFHIPGVEYSADQRNRSWNHMLGIMIQTIHLADGIHDRQAQINQAHAEGGLAYLCHPYDEHIHRRGWNSDDILSLVKDYDGIEIHNGSSYHEPGGRDYPYKVDLVLMSGRRINVIAVDDFHRNPSETMDRGYVVVNCSADGDAVTRDDMIAALKSGNYFSAGRVSTSHPTSPRFTEIAISGPAITVATDKPTDIEFITARHNYHKEGPNYTYRQENTTTAEYTASRDDLFIRVKAVFKEDGLESYAWSNPIYVVMEEE